MTDESYEVLLKKEDTVIGKIVSLPEIIQGVVEKTNHSNSSKGAREFISSGLKEISEFIVQLNDAQDQETILDSLGTIATYHICFPAPSNLNDWAFSAFPIRISVQGLQTPDTLATNVTFRPTGNVTIK